MPIAEPAATSPGAEHDVVPLILPTLAFVLATATQATFLFFLVPAYAQAHALGNLQLVAFTVNAVATFLVAIPAGRLADLVPRRRAMRVGAAGAAAGALALALMPPGVEALFISSILMGGSTAYAFIAFQSYLGDVLHAANLAHGYAATTALGFLGSAAAPMASAVVVASAPTPAAGATRAALLLAGLAITAGLATLALPGIRTPQSPPGAPPRIGFSVAAYQSFRVGRSANALVGPEALRHRGALLPYGVTWALLGIGYGLSSPWMGPHMIETLRMAPATWGTVLGVGTALGAGATYLVGRFGGSLRDAFLWTTVASFGVAASLIGFGLTAISALASVLFYARMSFGNVTSPVLNTGLARDVMPSMRGRSFAVVNLAWNLTWAIGALLGGLMLPQLGGRIFIIAALSIALAPVAGFMLRRKVTQLRRQAQERAGPREESRGEGSGDASGASARGAPRASRTRG